MLSPLPSPYGVEHIGHAEGRSAIAIVCLFLCLLCFQWLIFFEFFNIPTNNKSASSQKRNPG
jgi:hypothetical protein